MCASAGLALVPHNTTHRLSWLQLEETEYELREIEQFRQLARVTS